MPQAGSIKRASAGTLRSDGSKKRLQMGDETAAESSLAYHAPAVDVEDSSDEESSESGFTSPAPHRRCQTHGDTPNYRTVDIRLTDFKDRRDGCGSGDDFDTTFAILKGPYAEFLGDVTRGAEYSFPPTMILNLEASRRRLSKRGLYRVGYGYVVMQDSEVLGIAMDRNTANV